MEDSRPSGMLNAIILDDEEFGRATLGDMLNAHCKNVNVVAEYNSAREALDMMGKHKFQLLFLDIEMPEMDGFEFLNQIGKINFDIIFTTSNTGAASRAFRVSATDYLLKPINVQELKEAVEKVSRRQEHFLSAEQIEFLFKILRKQNHQIDKIAVHTPQGLEFVDFSRIVYCAADSNYTNIHLDGKRKMLVSKTLKDIQETLPKEKFFRVHQSYLVNLSRIRKYVKGDGGYLVMDNDDTVTVARSKKDALLNLF